MLTLIWGYLWLQLGPEHYAGITYCALIFKNVDINLGLFMVTVRIRKLLQWNRAIL